MIFLDDCMNERFIKQRIEQHKEQIKKDEQMMEEHPDDLFWIEDYNLQVRLLTRYEEKLKSL